MKKERKNKNEKKNFFENVFHHYRSMNCSYDFFKWMMVAYISTIFAHGIVQPSIHPSIYGFHDDCPIVCLTHKYLYSRIVIWKKKNVGFLWLLVYECLILSICYLLFPEKRNQRWFVKYMAQWKTAKIKTNL